MKGKKIGVGTASAFVIANMVGTGVFTSLGLQLLTTTNPVSIVLLWIIGGIIAICGALCYGELGAAMPRSGGEYQYLSVIYHPAVGFLSGWVSLVVGFAAPVALACMALSGYVCAIFPMINQKLLSFGVLVLITLIHSFSVKFGTVAQNFLTIMKLIIIVVFIVAGLNTAPIEGSVFDLAGPWSAKDILSPGFAVAIIYVYYSYSGWNAAAYISNEIEKPQRNLPLSLSVSTLIVIVLYVLINVVFMRTATLAQMTGEIEVGIMSAMNIFGSTIGKFVGLLIAFMLLSSISSMVFTGPRVSQTMGEDHPLLGFLAKKNKFGNPIVAMWTQFTLSALLILTGSFSLVTKYTGILLSICSLLAVLGVIVHRKRFPDVKRPFKTLGYPVTPIIFAIIILWSISYLFYEDIVNTFVNHTQSFMWMTVMSVCTLAVGYVIYLFDKKKIKQAQ